MEEVNHEPIRYDSKQKTVTNVANIIGVILLGVPAIALFIFGLIVLFTGNYAIFVYLFFMSFILGWGCWKLSRFIIGSKRNRYLMDLNEDGIREKHYKNNKEISDRLILFKEMEYILITNYIRRSNIYRQRDVFHLDKIIFIKYGDNYFIKRFEDPNELAEWMIRLQDKGKEIHYSDYDLSEVYKLTYEYQISYPFDKVDGFKLNDWDVFFEKMGMWSYNPFLAEKWLDDSLAEQVKQIKKKKTKKWEWRTASILVLYSIVILPIVLPLVPVEQVEFLFEEEIYTSFVFVIYIFLPFIMTFWRSYTKWYLPFLYLGSLILGSFPILGVLLMFDIPPLFDLMFVDFILIFMFWYVLLLATKVLKIIHHFIYKRNLF
ncbi:hypothetical protein [Gracilibacillus massiliensis]|uniref:hypothetical protein n=1 Tax=Gracilibacillus massiliensis TaxID=1564956 RepID=UPI00071C55FC|nr:hypothetical protein [Gracilibacillus massiliensis]